MNAKALRQYFCDSSLVKRLRRLLGPALCLALTACDFSRVETSCLQLIPENDLGQLITKDNGLVSDPVSDTDWYRCAVGQRYTKNGCMGEPLLMVWSEVEDYLQEISSKADQVWRLPSESESRSLAETTCLSPALNPTAFPNVLIQNHWVTGEGVRARKACGFYTYNGAVSCRLGAKDARPFFIVRGD